MHHRLQCDLSRGMSAEELPQLEVFHRVMELPVVERAVHVSASTYGWLKESSPLLYWALSSAEATLSIAGRQAAPIARKLEAPINLVDFTLCRGLDEIEKKMPFVKEEPEEVLGNAYAKARDTVSVPYDFVSDQLKEYLSKILNVGWNSVNVLLNTELGTICIKNFENSACLLDMFVEKYIPALDDENLAGRNPSLIFEQKLNIISRDLDYENQLDIPLKLLIRLFYENSANPNLFAELPSSEDRLLSVLQTLNRVSRKMGSRAAAQTQRHLRTSDLSRRLLDALTLLGITYAFGTLRRSVPSTLDLARFARVYPARPLDDGAAAAAPQPVAAH